MAILWLNSLLKLKKDPEENVNSSPLSSPHSVQKKKTFWLVLSEQSYSQEAHHMLIKVLNFTLKPTNSILKVFHSLAHAHCKKAL